MRLVNTLCGRTTIPRVAPMSLALPLLAHNMATELRTAQLSWCYTVYFYFMPTLPTQRKHTRLAYCLSVVVTTALALSLMYLVLWLVQHLVK